MEIAIIESGQKGYEIARQLDWHQNKLSQIIIGAHRANSEERRQLAD